MNTVNLNTLGLNTIALDTVSFNGASHGETLWSPYYLLDSEEYYLEDSEENYLMCKGKYIKPETKPSWSDLISGLVVTTNLGDAKLTTSEGSSGKSLCVMVSGYCLGEVAYPSDLTAKVSSFTLGQYANINHNEGQQGSGTITAVTYNGKAVTTDKTLPLEYAYQEESTKLNMVLTF